MATGAAFRLSAAQRQTLTAICDAFVPCLSDTDTAEVVRNQLASRSANTCASGETLEDLAAETISFCRRSASELGVPQAVERAIAEHVPADVANELSLLLTAMSSRLGMLAVAGVASPFADLDAPRREAVLEGMANSMLAGKRKAFHSLKSIIASKYFGCGNRDGGDQIWSVLGYKGPASPEAVAAAREAAGREEHIFTMINSKITGDVTLDCDVVIVGSGCGGAVVAAELSAAGLRVLVLEKGTYFPCSELSGVEGEAMDRLYERGGLLTTEDTAMPILAGATFGGGSTVNWACSLRTPDFVRQEWADKHGLPHFASEEFGKSLDAVCARIGVTAEGVAHNRNNALFIEGCSKCGYDVQVAPQSMADVSAGAPGAGSISVGDRYGIKQSMMATFLRDAASARVPAEFADRCRVSQVLHSAGVARGVRADIVGADGQRHQLEVQARTVVVACGSVHSPALLKRSRVPDRKGLIGKNLRLHPVALVVSEVPATEPDVSIWEGAPMTTVSNECVLGPTSDGYGCRLECPSVHPGLMSTQAIKPGRVMKETALSLQRQAVSIVLVRDRGSGEVRLDKRGEPRLYYSLGQHDAASMLDGMEKAIRVAAAAGAEAIGTTQWTLGGLRKLPPQAMAEARAKAVDDFVADVRKTGFPLHRCTIVSAHQMGTCRMGSTRENSVVDGIGQSWEVSGLFVADASSFPTSSGTNPMVTTLAIAHHVANQIKKLPRQSKL